MKKTILKTVILLWCVSAISTYSQHVSFTFTPQYFFVNAIKVNIGVSTGHDSWLVLSPVIYANEDTYSGDQYYYYDTESSYSNDYNKMLAYGLSLQHKNIFYHYNNDKLQLYFNYGLQYIKAEFKYMANDWYYIDYEGIQALQFGEKERSTMINQYSSIFNFGLHSYIDERFFFDAYGGVILKYSRHTFDSPTEKRFNDNIFGMGYTGFAPYIGISIGVEF